MAEEPMNLLSLDGGGVRGIVEVVILDELMRRIQKLRDLPSIPRPCDYFHLIGGTSTGGLVTILLGRMKMTTPEALDAYHKFAKKIFNRWNRKKRTPWKFKESTLAKTVRQMVDERGMGRTMLDESRDIINEKGHSFVCTIEQQNWNEAVLFRSYVNEVRNDDGQPRVDIWEAARATTAAPPFFKPIAIGDRVFRDGALRRNNPCPVVLEEAKDLFGPKRKIGLILSIGTGKAGEPVGIKRALATSGQLKRVWGFILAAKSNMTDTEKDHEAFEDRLDNYKHTYFRFNPGDGAKDIKLTAWKKMGVLEEITRKYMRQRDVSLMLDDVAQTLVNGWSEGLAVGSALSAERLSLEMKARIQVRPTNNFVGREDVLAKMELFFLNQRGNGRREFLLCGMSGVGKTEIALQFAQIFQSRRQARYLFIDATDMTTIKQSYQSYVSSIFPGCNNKSDEDVKNWLDTTSDEWLLVFDNCSMEVKNEYFMPKSGKGNVIYTTTNKEFRFQYKISHEGHVDVEELSQDNAVNLLMLLTDLAEEKWEENREPAVQIVECCSRLPKAIEVAGRHIMNSEMSFVEYVDVYFKHKFHYEKSLFKDASTAVQSAYITFEVTHSWLQSIRQNRKDPRRGRTAGHAIDLLSVICFFHNSGLDKDFFEHVANHREESRANGTVVTDLNKLSPLIDIKDEEGQWDPVPLAEAMDMLAQFSLIKSDHKNKRGWVMHDLVHQWSRSRLSAPENKASLLESRCLVTYALPPTTIPKKGTYLSQAGPVIRHILTCRMHYLDVENDDKYIQAFQDECMAQALEGANLDGEALLLMRKVAESKDDPEETLEFFLNELCDISRAKNYDLVTDSLLEYYDLIPGIVKDSDKQIRYRFRVTATLAKLYASRGQIHQSVLTYMEAWMSACIDEHGVSHAKGIQDYEFFTMAVDMAEVYEQHNDNVIKEHGWICLMKTALPYVLMRVGKTGTKMRVRRLWARLAIRGLINAAKVLANGGHPLSAVLLYNEILRVSHDVECLRPCRTRLRKRWDINQQVRFGDWLVKEGWLKPAKEVLGSIFPFALEVLGPGDKTPAIIVTGLNMAHYQEGNYSEMKILSGEIITGYQEAVRDLPMDIVMDPIFNDFFFHGNGEYTPPPPWQRRNLDNTMRQNFEKTRQYGDEEDEREMLIEYFKLQLRTITGIKSRNCIAFAFPAIDEQLGRFEELCPTEAEQYKRKVAPYKKALEEQVQFTEETCSERLDLAFLYLEELCEQMSIEKPVRPSAADFESAKDWMGDRYGWRLNPPYIDI